MNVVFVHGWACGWQDWTGVTSLLPDDVDVGLSKLPGSPGGVPLKAADGTVVGAIGVSGSTVEDDHTVAEAGAAALS